MRHILVVDDDLDIHALFKTYFKDLDYRVHFAANVKEALIHLEHDDIAFVFLDIIIGDNETSYQILNECENRPFFLMSSHITDLFCERIVSNHSNILDCLAKPFSKKSVLRLLRDYQSDAFEVTKFNPKDEVHFVKGHRKDIGESITHVEGQYEGKESAQVVKGSFDDLSEESQKVSGEREQPEENTLVKGKSDPKDDSRTVFHNDTSQINDQEILKIKHLKDLKELKGRGPLSRNEAGYTRLILAVLAEDLNEVSSALDDGEKIDSMCKEGQTALHFAVIKDQMEIVLFLIQSGAKLTVRDNEGREPLYFAIFRGNFEIVEELVEAGAPLNRRVNGKTYLMIAVIKRNEVLFKYLLSKGISLLVRDNDGFNINYYLKKYKLEHYLDARSA